MWKGCARYCVPPPSSRLGCTHVPGIPPGWSHETRVAADRARRRSLTKLGCQGSLQSLQEAAGFACGSVPVRRVVRSAPDVQVY